MKQNDGEQNNDYNFILKILQDNIGMLIDDFIVSNMNNRITKFSADAFTRWSIAALKKSEQEIINEFNKINNNKE